MNHRITIEGSDAAFDCGPAQSVLDAALRAGIELPYSCRKGVCGNCAGGLAAGEVECPPSDVAEPGQHLYCQCRPLGDIEIVPAAWHRIDPPARKVFSVNLDGVLRMSQCVAPVMRTSGGGSIINIGSTQGYEGSPEAVAYGASKAALRHLTVMMSKVWAPWNIRANILSPGSFMTDILERAEEFAPGSLERLASLNSQNRIAGVNEIVGPAIYLASAASSFVTGDDIAVSGGMRK